MKGFMVREREGKGKTRREKGRGERGEGGDGFTANATAGEFVAGALAWTAANLGGTGVHF
jgi:hypothetical protein